MKDFILKLIESKGLSERFWNEPSASVTVRPPAPKSLRISRNGNTVTITETHASIFGWFSLACPEDIEMKFEIDENGEWRVLYLKRGLEKPRLAFESDGGVISSKPVTGRRQWAFAKEWARELIARGMLRGFLDD